MARLSIIFLTVVMVGQWFALAWMSSETSCPSAAEKAAPVYNFKPTRSQTESLPLGNSVTPSNTENGFQAQDIAAEKLAQHFAPTAHSDAQAAATASTDRSAVATDRFAIAKELADQLSKISVSWASLVYLIAITLGALLLALVWRKLNSREKSVLVEPSEASEQPVSTPSTKWVVELNLDPVSRQKTIKAISNMGLRVLRRGKYSIVVGYYETKMEATKIITRLYAKYAIRGWLNEWTKV